MPYAKNPAVRALGRVYGDVFGGGVISGLAGARCICLTVGERLILIVGVHRSNRDANRDNGLLSAEMWPEATCHGCDQLQRGLVGFDLSNRLVRLNRVARLLQPGEEASILIAMPNDGITMLRGTGLSLGIGSENEA